jgi:hypothetical protein
VGNGHFFRQLLLGKTAFSSGQADLFAQIHILFLHLALAFPILHEFPAKINEDDQTFLLRTVTGQKIP